jgi:hypothetical protein
VRTPTDEEADADLARRHAGNLAALEAMQIANLATAASVADQIAEAELTLLAIDGAHHDDGGSTARHVARVRLSEYRRDADNVATEAKSLRNQITELRKAQL